MSGRWTLVCALALAVVGCRAPRVPSEPPPVADEAWQRDVQRGHEAYRAGDYARAGESYRAALRRGRAAADPAAAGLAAWHLAAAASAGGDLDQAWASLREAETALAAAGLPLADAQLLRGRLALQGGDAAAARAEAQALAGDPAQPGPVRAAAEFLLARCAYADGDAEAALASADQARQSARQAGAAELAGQAAALGGHIRCGMGRYQAGAADWTAAAASFREAGRYRSMADALRECALAQHAAGDPDAAVASAYAAARSLAAQGDVARARDLAGLARGWADAGDREAWSARFGDLLREWAP